GEKTTPEQDRRRSVQWISARVLGFTPVKINGQLYEHSDKTVEDLLIRPEMHFVLLQITKALNDDARFTARSAEV
ncbi:hypothetical protein BZU93_30325, partial [Salmonella enterica subsp. enterica]|nr:hypothetical protein [Salmonella enterica subsp. enterica serovar Enteritidis]